MCGRYNILPDAKAWIDGLETIRDLLSDHDWFPNYNITPSSWVPIIREAAGGDTLVLDKARWGFVPHWVKGEKPKLQPINARAEGVANKPFFREAFKQRRCLFVASGFYEWRRTERGKQPYNIVMQSGEPFLMAGIWDTWTGDDNAAIITTEANAMMAPIHDRMPVIIPSSSMQSWIFGDCPADFLHPPSDDLLRTYKVSKAVNSPANNRPDNIEDLT
jgi:putative SOS response-associated peptidase YedK